MTSIQSYGRAAPTKRAPRAKQIDRETHSALATALARTVAYANAGKPAQANDAAFHLLRVLKANGIEPKRASVAP
jgi:hypothetical protein